MSGIRFSCALKLSFGRSSSQHSLATPAKLVFMKDPPRCAVAERLILINQCGVPMS